MAGDKAKANREAGGKASGGQSAQDRYKMQKATERWNAGVGKYMPADYSPQNTRRPRGR